MSTTTITEVNEARKKFNATHPDNQRKLLAPCTEYQRAKIGEYAYVADRVARLYTSKGMTYDDLHSACNEAVVRCAIKMDSRPYAYTLVYQCCRDVCVDLLRAFYRERERVSALDDAAEDKELDGAEDALLSDMMRDAPADIREMIVAYMHLTEAQIKVQYDMSDSAFKKMRAVVREWVGSYLYD